MTSEPNQPEAPHAPDRLEMPAPTLWPMVLAVAVTLMGAGFVTNWLFTIVGVVIFIIALSSWMMQLMPGQGTALEEMVPPEERAKPVREHPSEVEHLRPGMAGHRMRVPEKVHPYSAGARGGLIGGVVMTVPAMLYGIFSATHSIWYPINLLAGMVLTLHGDLNLFHFGYFVVAVFIHVVLSLSLGLMYGVLLPMLPGRPLIWGGLVAPLLWTGASYGFMGVLNPDMADALDWPSFIVAQFVFGITAGIVVVRTEKIYAEEAGVPEIVRRARPTMRIPPDGGTP
jgi:hypothetical protein